MRSVVWYPGHELLVEAIAEQSSRAMHTGFCYSTAVVEDTAREVLALLGFEGGQCVFLSSGSEAFEYAVRAVRAVSDRPLDDRGSSRGPVPRRTGIRARKHRVLTRRAYFDTVLISISSK